MRASRMMWGLVLGACLAGVSLMAQQSGQMMKSGETEKGEAASRLNHMAKELNLTDEQKEKLKPILQSEVQDAMTVKGDASLTPPQKRSKMMEIHEKYAPQINGILTPEQQEKWKAMKREMMEKHKGEMGGGMEHQ